MSWPMDNVAKPLHRRTLLAGVAWAAPAAVVVASTPLVAASDDVLGDVWAVAGNYTLSGAVAPSGSTAAFSSDVAFADGISFGTNGTGNLVFGVPAASLIMDDGEIYPGTGDDGAGVLGEAGSVLGLRFPGVRIIDPGLLGGTTIKHLRYPSVLQVQLSLAARDGAASATAFLVWSLTGRPTQVRSDNSITYVGEAAPLT